MPARARFPFLIYSDLHAWGFRTAWARTCPAFHLSGSSLVAVLEVRRQGFMFRIRSLLQRLGFGVVRRCLTFGCHHVLAQPVLRRVSVSECRVSGSVRFVRAHEPRDRVRSVSVPASDALDTRQRSQFSSRSRCFARRLYYLSGRLISGGKTDTNTLCA